MSDFNRKISTIMSDLKDKKIRIAFSEGEDVRILKACERLSSEHLIKCLLVGNKARILSAIKKNDIKLANGYYEVLDPLTFPHKEDLIKKTLKVRAGKQTKQEIEAWYLKPNYFIAMLLMANYADGGLGGATYSTADTIRPALQIVKAKEKIVSSFTLLVKGDQFYVFADCSINIAPNSEQLAEIAFHTANSALEWNIKPKIAFLSFSTHGSAKHPSVDLITDALAILRKRKLSFDIDGELQFDAAFSVDVARKKQVRDFTVAGSANCFIFPNLAASNIGYKIAERLGGFFAFGPIIQGLKLPFNDLSRGCSEIDVYYTALVTGMSALKHANKRKN